MCSILFSNRELSRDCEVFTRSYDTQICGFSREYRGSYGIYRLYRYMVFVFNIYYGVMLECVVFYLVFV